MRSIRLTLAAVLLLCPSFPNDAAAQQQSSELAVAVAPAPDSTGAGVAGTRTAGMVVGALIGGVIGGAVSAGCFYIVGMGGVPAALYCAAPAVLGVAFGAWVGASVTNARSGLAETP